MEKNNALALRIRAFRKLKGYTQNELAEKLDVSIAVLGSIERGTRKADPKIIRKISEVLGIEPGELSQPPAAGGRPYHY
ncbi:helix-turn-helix transcriptional regulator [Paenibacillus filicis]|uniref:Helix-turn-helix transcriptional regulator n=1 Tax=Paenibacillus gyeongsangnamensis TaxID=3388067 RepID=A0ABT4QL60_9BACL|nr:helix-turn-helix transcriptional regulator [Paenibacillus filicis]MCZ8517601.1 helix-turn-helix transcriptional regulator [Paenibacillus filicis]